MVKKIYHWSTTWTGTVVIVLSIIFFIAQAFVIPSGSMKNTLLIGDMLFVKKFSYGIPVPRIPWIELQVLPDFNDNGHILEGDRPKRGDIVVFRYPQNELIHYVKRCVAVGGDLVALQDKHLLLHPHQGNDYARKNYKDQQLVELDGRVWVVDPHKKAYPGIHTDPKVTQDGMNYGQLFNMMPVQVPQDEFFMMGDNRDHSNDSRFWGTVPYKYIVGKPWFVYFSWNENKEIRWDRVFRSVESLEQEINYKDAQVEGIY
ncbi:MAG: signal peptidase I [Campylobacterota bacterium]|nr:signal peptidase I [Campylobacterota bacterium]